MPRQVNGLNKAQKSKIYYFFLILSILLFCLFQASCNPSFRRNPQDNVTFVEVKLKEVDEYTDQMLLKVMNNRNISFECEADLRIFIHNTTRTERLPLGMLNAFEVKAYEFPVKYESGASMYNISLDCREQHFTEPKAFNFTLVKEAANRKNCSTLEQGKSTCELILNTNLLSCMSETADDTYFCLAFLTQNSSICDFSSPLTKYKCKAFLMKNYHFCSLYEEKNLKEICYLEFALNNNIFFLCNAIEDADKRTACFSVTNNDFDSCISVNDLAAKKLCISTLMRQKRDSSLCTKLPDALNQYCLSSME